MNKTTTWPGQSTNNPANNPAPYISETFGESFGLVFPRTRSDPSKRLHRSPPSQVSTFTGPPLPLSTHPADLLVHHGRRLPHLFFHRNAPTEVEPGRFDRRTARKNHIGVKHRDLPVNPPLGFKKGTIHQSTPQPGAISNGRLPIQMPLSWTDPVVVRSHPPSWVGVLFIYLGWTENRANQAEL